MTIRSCGVNDIRPRLRPEKRPDRERRIIMKIIVAQTGKSRRVTINFRDGLDLINQVSLKKQIRKKLTHRLGEINLMS